MPDEQQEIPPTSAGIRRGTRIVIVGKAMNAFAMLWLAYLAIESYGAFLDPERAMQHLEGRAVAAIYGCGALLGWIGWICCYLPKTRNVDHTGLAIGTAINSAKKSAAASDHT